MNLQKANSRVEEIENEINLFLDKKELELSKVLPKATNYKEEVVKTSRVNRNQFLYYTCQIEKIDKEINYLYKEKEILLQFIDKELKRLKKYNDTEQLIIYYKEQCLEKLTWLQISYLVHYSEAQCRRIYRKYKNQRDI